jgi:dimethylargininase
MPLAITRQISPRFAECELTHIERTPIDLTRAREQHRGYAQALHSLGCHVVELPPEPDLPDSVFVEDMAIILPEAAVITLPGAPSRRPETKSIAEVLLPHHPLIYLREPATLDGGDVLVLDKHIYVGLSTRSNLSAVEQLQQQLGKYGYFVSGVELHDCLHLKSAVTRIDQFTLLINPAWVDLRHFANFRLLEVAPEEPFAANVLMIGGRGIYPDSFPKTREKLKHHGVDLMTLDVSELSKAEGAVTCCSLILF